MQKTGIVVSVVWELTKLLVWVSGAAEARFPLKNHRTASSASELAKNAASSSCHCHSACQICISDIGSRMLALQLYYMELVEGKSYKMFLVGPITCVHTVN